MSKWSKRLLSLAAIGGAIAGLVYYLKKSDSCEDDDLMDDFEDEDFDLDNDLKPVTDREYVPLNTAPKADDAEDDTDEEAAAEQAADEEADGDAKKASE